MEAFELLDRVESVVASMGERYRIVFHRGILGDLPTDALAAYLGVKPGSVYQMVRRVRLQIARNCPSARPGHTAGALRQTTADHRLDVSDRSAQSGSS